MGRKNYGTFTIENKNTRSLGCYCDQFLGKSVGNLLATQNEPSNYM
jgi:hypothetical protein